MGKFFAKVGCQINYWIAVGFGSGLSPWMPGTCGTVVGILIYALVLQHLSLPIYLLVSAVSLLLGIPLCDVVARQLDQPDPSSVVWDEIVGYWLTMIFAPAGWLSMLLGFLYFRLFDIWKPGPVGWIDKRTHGGFSIMMDDVVAAVFAAGLLQLTFFFLKNLGK